MGRYGLIDDDDKSEVSLDTTAERPNTKKRPHPGTFPQVEYTTKSDSYSAAKSTVIGRSQEWTLPLAVAGDSIMDCFGAVLRWIRLVSTEFGGKLLSTGK